MRGVPRTIDKYELKESLGYGGMAEVWKAWDTQLHRHVAIKLLHADLQHDPTFVTRFEREARLIASLHHPNIIRIFDFRIYHFPDRDEQLAYMVMEYIEGQTMAHYLRTTSHAGNIPSPTELLHLFVPISLAIDYAHQKGMIHRDIKPSNILLDQRGPLEDTIGEPILSDFGIAKLLDSSSTYSNWWMGTPAYISPEQALGQPGNERSDIYALSVILYEACTGRVPFQGDNPTAIALQHINSPVPAPNQINPNLPEALIPVIAKGLAKDPEARFSRASALCIAMAEAFNLPLPENLKQAVAQTENNKGNDLPTLTMPPPALTISLSEKAAAAQSSSSPSQGAPPTPTPARTALLSSTTHEDSPGTQTPPAPSQPLQQQAPEESTSDPWQVPGDWSVPPSSPPSSFKRSLPSFAGRKGGLRGRVITAIVLAILVLGASLGAFLLLTPKASPSRAVATIASNPVVGHAYFMNSGQLNQNNSQGINDILTLDLQSIPAPQPGKVYYAWLLPDILLTDAPTVPLGKLTPAQGHASLVYQDPKHTNLLAFDSRILITQEDASTSPITYTPDKSAWSYYAQFPQAKSPQGSYQFSMLDHLRHLLSNSPELQIRKLYGGLDMWFLRNTQKVAEWSTAARDVWGADSAQLQRQMIRILDYLDGASFVAQDIPTIKPALIADRQAAQVPLLGPSPGASHDPAGFSYANEPAPGYIYLISWHMSAAVLSHDATPEQRTLATQIQAALNEVMNQFVQIHQIAKQLALMSTAQLSQPAALTLLNELVTLTQSAYTGRSDPATGQQQGGALWICNNIQQRMASLALQRFQAQ